MPSLAYIDADIRCGKCNSSWGHVAAIAWGLCGPADYNAGLRYQIGDSIRWRSDFDDSPRGYTSFRGKVSMVNHGDPSILDAWLLESTQDPYGQECGACNSTAVVLVEIRDGGIQSVLAKNVHDTESVDAVELSGDLESRVYEHRKWRHGVSSAHIASLGPFLEQFNLQDLSTLIGSFDQQPPTTADIASAKKFHASVDEALLSGFGQFSTRVLCHAVAEAIGSDAHLMERRLWSILKESGR